jgi:hypothetical protein
MYLAQNMQTKEVCSPVGKDEKNNRDRGLLPWLHEPHQPAHFHVGLLQPWVIIATSASMQWYMSLTDAIAPCLPVHWQQQPKQGHRVLFAGTELYQVTCKIIPLVAEMRRGPCMLVLD